MLPIHGAQQGFYDPLDLGREKVSFQFSEERLRDALPEWKISNSKINQQIAAIKELIEKGSWRGSPLIYNREGVAYLFKAKSGLPLTMQVHQTGEIYLHQHQSQGVCFIGNGELKKVYQCLSAMGNKVASATIKRETLIKSVQDLDLEIDFLTKFKEGPFFIKMHHVYHYQGKNEESKRGIIAELCDLGQASFFLKKAEPQMRLRVLSQLALGLSFIHENGYAYCDIKADNFLMKSTPNGPEPRIIDFGYLKKIGSQVDICRTPILACGLFYFPEFGSPLEVYDSKIVTITDKLDVWAFGIYAISYLMQEQVIATQLRQNYLLQHKFATPSELNDIRRIITEGCISFKQRGFLIEFLMKMICPDPHWRPTMKEVEAMFKDLSEQKPLVNFESSD